MRTYPYLVLFFRALLTSELSEIFANAPPAPQVRFLANQKVVGAWREATGRGPASSTAESSTGETSFPYVLLCVLAHLFYEAPEGDDPRRVPAAEDDCPICYDHINPKGLDLKGLEKDLEWCNECHNAVHKECWTQCMPLSIILWLQTYYDLFRAHNETETIAGTFVCLLSFGLDWYVNSISGIGIRF